MLLNSKRFLPLFISQFVGAFNDNACKNALLVWFTYNGYGNENVVNLSAAVFILPFFLFSGIAGQIADRFEKSKLSQRIKISEIIVMLFFIFSMHLKSINLLLFSLFLMGMQSTFFGPIKYSLLPEHLATGELILGNGLVEGGTFLAILFGTIFGSSVIAYNNLTPLAISVILMAIIGWISSIYIPKTKTSKSSKIELNIIKSSKHVINHAMAEKIVWHAIIAISWFWFIGVIFLTGFPLYTVSVVHGSPVIVTLFLMTFSIGIGLGSITSHWLQRGLINTKLMSFANLIISVGIFCFCYCSSYFSYSYKVFGVLDFINHKYGICIIISLFSIAFSSGIYTVPLYAIMQHYSKPERLSQIIAANNIINALFMILANFWAIALFNFGLDIVQVIFSVGIINLIFLIFNQRKNLYDEPNSETDISIHSKKTIPSRGIGA